MSTSMSFVWQEHLIENEVSILRRVKHPNIIMLVEEMETPTELFLVMELVKVRRQTGFIGVNLRAWTSQKVSYSQHMGFTGGPSFTYSKLLWPPSYLTGLDCWHFLTSPFLSYRVEISLMQLLLQPSTQREMAVPWCTTWPMPSGTCMATASYTETSSLRTFWWVQNLCCFVFNSGFCPFKMISMLWKP